MADWEKDRVHCLFTWMTLVDLDQTGRGFDTAGPTRMTSLSFWDPHATEAVRKMRAKTVAIQCDNLFRRHYGAKYEDGKTRTKAVNASVRVMTAEDSTVADLAETNNQNYLYFGE